MNKQNRDTPQRPPRRKQRRIIWPRLLLLLAAVLFVSVLGIGSGLIFAWATDAPHFDPNELDVHTASILYDCNNNEYARLHAGENRVLVEIDKVPQHLRDAFLAIEDNKFYDHHGVDFLAMIRAVIANVTGGFGAQGASTITQQVVKDAYLTPEKTIKRKVQEVVLAFQLERT
ncbi:MAG: transglycosylase domain-containing protein, partial [Heliobacteriaceae bacterium]|nr:transglycosylase domain-containing protein [Heliobacteriaceae bacterium]